MKIASHFSSVADPKGRGVRVYGPPFKYKLVFKWSNVSIMSVLKRNNMQPLLWFTIKFNRVPWIPFLLGIERQCPQSMRLYILLTLIVTKFFAVYKYWVLINVLIHNYKRPAFSGPSIRKVLDPLCSCLYLQKLASGSFYRRIWKIQIWNILDCHVTWQHSNACFQWAVSVQRSLRVKRITLFASFSSQFSFDLCWCVLRFC